MEIWDKAKVIAWLQEQDSDLLEDYVDMLDNVDTIIYQDEHGTLRFKADETIQALWDAGALDLNELWANFEDVTGERPRTSETMKKFYRDLGYSLFRYWEVFYFNLRINDAIIDNSRDEC